MSAPRPARATWIVFGASSLLAVLTGVWVAAAHGVPARAWSLNIAAWIVGAGLAVGVSRLRPRAAWGWMALAAVGIGATLLAPGLSGVHRWIGLGPVRLNAAELLAPIALSACAGLDPASRVRIAFPPLLAVILAGQPDASQAAATVAAGLVTLITSRRSIGLRVLAALASAAAFATAILRPDPLSPVPEVEGIVGLAAALSPAVAALGLLALAGSVLAPLGLARAEPPDRDAAIALTAYLAVAALAPAFGAFPVPLMGTGISPILGAWLAIGGLMALAGREAAPT